MSQETTSPSPEELARKKHRAKRVTQYLMVLFAAAFLLLLISFFMQQRNHQVLVRLNDSITDAQEDLKVANGQLQLEIADLQKKVTTLEEELKDKGQEAEALEWLRLLEGAVRSSNVDAKELLEEFRETGLDRVLPDTSAVEGAPSPKESYESLCRILE